jgi:DnaA family protein
MTGPLAKGGSAQLPLALRLAEHASFATFEPGPNAQLVAHLSAVAASRVRELLWLAARPGSGKSHLLQAVCRLAGERGSRAMYLPLGDGLEPDVLVGLETLDVLALDDVDAVAGDARFEERLFPLFNGFYRDHGSLVAAASNPPGAVGFALPDLASRAAGAVVYTLAPLGENDYLAALARHARSRGMELDEASAAYLMSRVERDMPSMCRWLDRVDRESLAAQRKVTVPFIRELLEAERAE